MQLQALIPRVLRLTPISALACSAWLAAARQQLRPRLTMLDASFAKLN